MSSTLTRGTAGVADGRGGLGRRRRRRDRVLGVEREVRVVRLDGRRRRVGDPGATLGDRREHLGGGAAGVGGHAGDVEVGHDHEEQRRRRPRRSSPARAGSAPRCGSRPARTAATGAPRASSDEQQGEDRGIEQPGGERRRVRAERDEHEHADQDEDRQREHQRPPAAPGGEVAEPGEDGVEQQEPRARARGRQGVTGAAGRDGSGIVGKDAVDRRMPQTPGGTTPPARPCARRTFLRDARRVSARIGRSRASAAGIVNLGPRIPGAVPIRAVAARGRAPAGHGRRERAPAARPGRERARGARNAEGGPGRPSRASIRCARIGPCRSGCLHVPNLLQRSRLRVARAGGQAGTLDGRAEDAQPEEIAAAGVRWLNLERPREADREWLEREFGFHPLAIEDVASRNQRPKLDAYDDYLFIVLHFPVFDKPIGPPAHGRARPVRRPRLPDHAPRPEPAAARRDVRALPRARGGPRRDVLEGDGLPPVPDRRHLRRCLVPDAAQDGRQARPARGRASSRACPPRSSRSSRTRSRRSSTSGASSGRCAPCLRDLERTKQRYLADDLDIYFDDITDAAERIWDVLENYKEVVEALEGTNESVLSHRLNASCAC